ncbi:hypothetical protein B194_1472 [Serratia plymuthica A30]|nr:hypothetical protein B194_1472 [Serratia plymuthica A30]
MAASEQAGPVTARVACHSAEYRFFTGPFSIKKLLKSVAYPPPDRVY